MSDPHPEADLFRSQTTQNSGQEVGPYTLPVVLVCDSVKVSFKIDSENHIFGILEQLIFKSDWFCK